MGIVHSEVSLFPKTSVVIPATVGSGYVLGDASNAAFVGDYQTLHVNYQRSGGAIHLGVLISWYARQAKGNDLIYFETFSIAPNQTTFMLECPVKAAYCTIQFNGNGVAQGTGSVIIWGSQRITPRNWIHRDGAAQLQEFNVVQAASTTTYLGDHSWIGQANVFVQVYGPLGATAIYVQEVRYDTTVIGTLVRWDASTTYGLGLVDTFSRNFLIGLRGGYPSVVVVTPGGVRTIVSIEPVIV